MIFGVERVLLFVVRAFLLHDGKGAVQVHTVFSGVHNTDRNVGAVVCRPFQTGEEIQPYKTCLYGAGAVFQAQDMGVSHFFF